MTARAVALILLAALAGPRPAAADPDGSGAVPAQTGPAGPAAGAADQAPLVVTMPDTQPALPSGMIKMDPSQFPSTGNANRLEPNIDGGGSRVR